MLKEITLQINNDEKSLQAKLRQAKEPEINPVSPSSPVESEDSDSNSPREYVSIHNLRESTRMRVGLHVNTRNSKHLEKLFEAIASFDKKDGRTILVDVSAFIDIGKWRLLYSKLEENLDLLSKVDSIDLQETDISMLELEELYTLYRNFGDKEKFPRLYIADTPALDGLRDYRNFFQKLHRPLDFFDKLRVLSDKALDRIDKWEELQRSREESEKMKKPNHRVV